MTGRVQTNRSIVSGNRPTGRQVGELYVNLVDGQLGVINTGGAAQDLIGVTFFSPFSNYVAGNHVLQAGTLYRAMGTIAAGVFNSTQWQALSSTSGFLPLSGGTMTGTLTLVGIPSGANDAVPKQYADGLVVSGGGIGPNRLINGDMRIDQRNAGNIITPAPAAYTLDRWRYGATQTGKLQTKQNLNALTPLATGFPYYLGAQNIGTAYTVLATDAFSLAQPVEADAVGDLGWGTANVLPVTLSFWAQCTGITGTFSGAIRNSASNRSYPFSFALLTSNVWQKFSITIPGDPLGTWVTSGNGTGMVVDFNLGSGSTWLGPANAWANANFVGVTGSANILPNTIAAVYFTGVKLEAGSVATAFPQQSLANSMSDCQRYYQKLGGATAFDLKLGGYVTALGDSCSFTISYPPMRTAPTVATVGTFSTNNLNGPISFFPGLQAMGAQLTGAAVGHVAWTNDSGSSPQYVTLNAEL